jgi:molybdopterin synthase sulfur carrier subunit
MTETTEMTVNGKPHVRVKVPTMLRARAGGEAILQGRGDTLRELLADLERRYPGFSDGIVTEHGSLHRFVNLYLNSEDVRYLGSLDAHVADGDTLSILPAVAGG